jgi:hypothetical protein
MVARTRLIVTLYVHYLSCLENYKIRFYPITGLTLLWVRNPFGGNFNHWQVSRKEAGQTWQTFEETSGYVRPERVNKWPNSMTDI